MPVPHDGPPGHTLGMSVPHATVVGEVVGHRGAHSHTSVVALQTMPVPQAVPRPGQVMPGHELGIIAPQVTADASGHVGTHSHRWPEGHCVPVPEQLMPPQVSRMGCPHATAVAAGHDGTHSQRPALLQR